MTLLNKQGGGALIKQEMKKKKLYEVSFPLKYNGEIDWENRITKDNNYENPKPIFGNRRKPQAVGGRTRHYRGGDYSRNSRGVSAVFPQR